MAIAAGSAGVNNLTTQSDESLISPIQVYFEAP
jgi:hypothetical protein